MLKNILLTAINDRSSSSPASLQALLASRLPFHLAALGGSLHSPLSCAALAESSGAAKVSLLQ